MTRKALLPGAFGVGMPLREEKPREMAQPRWPSSHEQRCKDGRREYIVLANQVYPGGQKNSHQTSDAFALGM
jgi:hypothetical protein